MSSRFQELLCYCRLVRRWLGNFKIEGMKGFKSLKKLNTTKHFTSANYRHLLKDAKSDAPVDTGNLKRGMKLKGERSKQKGKKVYRIVFDSAMNDIFQKKDSSGKVIAYYPISQEYGFFAKNGRYIPGYRFLHNSLQNNSRGNGKNDC